MLSVLAHFLIEFNYQSYLIHYHFSRLIQKRPWIGVFFVSPFLCIFWVIYISAYILIIVVILALLPFAYFHDLFYNKN